MGRAPIFAALVAVGVLASMLSGCGFTPLYATPGVASGLSRVAVDAGKGRVAYLLRQDLDDALAHDMAEPAAWRLNLDILQTRTPRGLSLNDVAERYDVALTVKYTLTAVGASAAAYSGEVTTSVSYDAADAPYAGIAARQDAQERAASDAARRIQIQLAAWMARHSGG
jgi:LPS-assembly lipoprotein